MDGTAPSLVRSLYYVVNMLNYFSGGGQSYFMDFVTVSATNIVNGANSFTFNNPAQSLFAYYISKKINCIPIQLTVYNTTDKQFTFGQFTNGSTFWCDKITFNIAEYTVVYCTDQSKANHTHVDAIDQFLTLDFNSAGVPGGGGLNIWIMFSAWSISKYNLI